MAKKKQSYKEVDHLQHKDASRVNNPTAEYQSMVSDEDKESVEVAYERRNQDLDPQLVWRGKDQQDWSDLVVPAPPLYIQEHIQPHALIQDLKRRSQQNEESEAGAQLDMFGEFNGEQGHQTETSFYQHNQKWSNRMILGDSLQVMASLAEKEGLRGQVQCIYIDPPYGIKFNSNFQWSTTTRDVKDGKAEHITREPEQVKAFRDTWKDGIHSYLTYLRDRLTVARDLLKDSGSVFVQIGDENVHRLRAIMDEVFGPENFMNQISFQTKIPLGSKFLPNLNDYILWYSKYKNSTKYRQLFDFRNLENEHYNLVEHERSKIENFNKKKGNQVLKEGGRPFRILDLVSSGSTQSCIYEFEFQGEKIKKPYKGKSWKTTLEGMEKLRKSNRLAKIGKAFGYKLFYQDYPVKVLDNIWKDTVNSFLERNFVVQTNPLPIQRCMQMTTDPGDLVLDPTCGSGTTAYVAEQWGRRWITIDTSRVALALARSRLMGAQYPFYLLSDSKEGQQKEAELQGKAPPDTPTYGSISHGFVYERVPHITLKSIANNTEIDVIWDKYQETMEPLREQINDALKKQWLENGGTEDAFKPLEEWEIPREQPDHWPKATNHVLQQWWEQRQARQKEINDSIARNADQEYLYDRPYQDKNKIRVAGPFTVESLSPHRNLGVDENDELIDAARQTGQEDGQKQDFTGMILENLKAAGIQQAHKEDRINFTALTPWPGHYVGAEGRFDSDQWTVNSGQLVASEGEQNPGNQEKAATSTPKEVKAGVFIGPEFGTVSRPDLVTAAREAADAGFDVLISCAFSYDAHTEEFDQLGKIPVLKATMNADLHMADNLKNTGQGNNLFVIFGEPDIDVVSEAWLVDSSGKQIAPCEIFKLLSGTNSLAEINRLKHQDLRDYAALSCRREIWDYLTNAEGSNVNTGQHSGGASQEVNGGVSAVAWHCQRIAGGTGDLPGHLREITNGHGGELSELVGKLRGDQQNAKQAHAIAINPPLTTCHYTQVKLNGVDVFHPNTGEIRSDSTDGIACWFIDTDYNEEKFFVRHAYFLGAGDPYKSLKRTLKAEIDEEAWETLYSDTSRPFAKPENGRIAVKVINHLGDEVMKVFRV